MKIKYPWWVLIPILGMLGVTAPLFAGSVRTLHVNDKAMERIQLSMGQSTVLRFREKPKKVIVGNQNYFNVEFIDNDLTIQPLGPVTSNLFVYGEFHTYGFILNVKNPGPYDDIVNVYWKLPYRLVSDPAPAPPKIKRLFINRSFKVGKRINAMAKSIEQNSSLGLYVLDLELKNVSKEKLSLAALGLKLTRSGKDLGNYRYVLEKELIEPGEFVKVRVFQKATDKQDFTISARLGKDSGKIIISRNAL